LKSSEEKMRREIGGKIERGIEVCGILRRNYKKKKKSKSLLPGV
jgi:hypothetical protein